MKRYTRALTIAGSDSGGGAGIQADLKTFAALGCYGSSCITALTAQNTTGVKAIFPISAAFVGQQIDAVLEDIGTDVIKVGMLFSEEIINVIVPRVKGYKLVIDPVMVAKNGAHLLKKEAVLALTQNLFPWATLITPNLDEAAAILRKDITHIEEAAHELLAFGSEAVLIKGGHMTGRESNDFLLTKSGLSQWFNADKIMTNNTHGTGCSLSSAITAFLAKDYTLTESVKLAKDYITEALEAGSSYVLGSLHGPIHHFYRNWL